MSCQQVQGRTIKAYAVGTAERNPALPDVPTSKEAGLPEFEAQAWNALFAPKGTPKPVLDKLTDALDKALDDEEVRKRLLELGSVLPNKERARPAGARRAGQERDRSLDAGHQGGPEPTRTELEGVHGSPCTFADRRRGGADSSPGPKSAFAGIEG